MEVETKNQMTDILNNLRSTCYDIGINYDSLPTQLKKYFIKTEDNIITVINNEIKARKLLKNNNLSIQGLSKRTGITRKTFYNNDILIAYINERDKEFKKIDASLIDVQKDEEIRRLNKEIEEFHKRDVEYMKMKNALDFLVIENQKLQDQLSKSKAMYN